MSYAVSPEPSTTPPALPCRSHAARLATTYAIGAAGGALAAAAHVPLPWLVGPLFATGAASLAAGARPVLAASRQAAQAVIGAALGLYFTREVVTAVAGTLPWMLAACVAGLAAGAAGARLLARRAGLDPATAFYASVPAGAAEMSVLGARAGGDASVIAVAQAFRVLGVVTVMPLVLTLAGARGADAWAPAGIGISASGLLRLGVVAGGAGLVAHVVRVPNGWLLGPLVASAAMTAAGASASALPPHVIEVAQVVIGCALGSRFDRQSFRGAGALAAAIALATAQGIAILAAFAVVIAGPSGHSVWTLLLATAPGGVAEMCLTARTLQLGVPLVTAFHVLRLVALITLAPLAFGAWQRAVRPERSGVEGPAPSGPEP